MEGRLIQINNVDGEPIGLFHTNHTEVEVPQGRLVNWYRDYDDTDQFEDEGVDGFESFVQTNHHYTITRVFVEEENL